MTRISPAYLLLGTIVVLVLSSSMAQAQFCNPIELHKLVASDGSWGSYFGWAVDISGDVAIVGAPRDDDRGGNSGSAFIFRYDGTNWNEEAKLVPAGIGGDDYFGWRVSIQDDLAIVSTELDDDLGRNAGAAYIFRYDGMAWNEEAKLTASDGHENAAFGSSVALTNNLAFVGAMYQDDPERYCGAVYVFEYDGQQWMETQKLVPSDATDFGCFGYSMSLDGNRLLIGATQEEPDFGVKGKAYVFEYDGVAWVERHILEPADGVPGDSFAVSLALDGNHALIGRLWDNQNERGYGSVYAYRFNGVNWVEEQKVESPNQDVHTYMGYAVAMEGGTAVFGAFGESDQFNSCGGAYIYSRIDSQWVLDQVVFPSFQINQGGFGLAVAMDDGRAFIGAYKEGTMFDRRGAAYLLDLNCLAHVDILPQPLIAGSSALFVVSGATPNEPCYLTYSTSGLGELYVPFLNVTLDIDNPKQAGTTKRADAFGRVQWYLPIPQNAVGADVWMQGAQYENKTRVKQTYVVR